MDYITAQRGGNDMQTSLANDGYCVVPNVLDDTMLQSLRERFSDNALSQTNRENFGDSGAFVVADYHDPVMVDLLTWPTTLQILKDLGFAQPKLHNFYVSTKPPQAEPLAWHSDLFYEYERPEPAELFLIYYLQDTTVENGCLRVVPGSHKWTHRKRHAQPDDALPRGDELDVPIKAGSLFIGDRRIMHATHANSSNAWRTCLTIAYAPLFTKLPESVQALIVKNRCLPPQEHLQNPPARGIEPRLAAILPEYSGAVQPISARS
jgi:ectoine hydroxylase-related dioxygenase (phytanoyl-CoA dioxygenase family)